jgi:hemerythrin-like domain-containing protein
MSVKVIRTEAAEDLRALDEELAPARERNTRPLPFVRPRGETPFEELQKFHGEIRRSLDLLDDLARAPTYGEKEREVAYTLWEFFTGPLIWHDIDEELSVVKRLRETRKSPIFEALLTEMSDAHEEMEAMLQLLRPHLERLVRGGEPADAGAFVGAALELRELLEPHLTLEEREIFPFARFFFDEEALAEIREEIAARMEARGEPTAK